MTVRSTAGSVFILAELPALRPRTSYCSSALHSSPRIPVTFQTVCGPANQAVPVGVRKRLIRDRWSFQTSRSPIDAMLGWISDQYGWLAVPMTEVSDTPPAPSPPLAPPRRQPLRYPGAHRGRRSRRAMAKNERKVTLTGSQSPPRPLLPGQPTRQRRRRSTNQRTATERPARTPRSSASRPLTGPSRTCRNADAA